MASCRFRVLVDDAAFPPLQQVEVVVQEAERQAAAAEVAGQCPDHCLKSFHSRQPRQSSFRVTVPLVES